MTSSHHYPGETIPYFKSGSRVDKKSIDPHRRIKQAIWLYFFLLVFEGALRKWALPGLSEPLLIVRDPVALWLVITCFSRGILKINAYVAGMSIIGALAMSTALAFGHGNAYVGLFGLRIFVLHFPLIFIIGRVFEWRDVIAIGKILLWLAIPMTILIILQFYSPQSAWINRSVTGGEGTGLTGALGYFRPPGTFSFNTGLGQFFSLAGGFIFYFWLENSINLKRWLLILATGCLLISIPFSISRSLFLSIAISFLFAIFASAQRVKYLTRFITSFLAIVILFTILNNFGFFQTGVEVFANRFESANVDSGGAESILEDRFFGETIGILLSSSHVPFWGYGLGVGTNAGAMILTGSTNSLSEGEWGRLVGEMGLLLGMATIFIRVWLTVKMMLRSISAMFKNHFLPWMLLSFVFPAVILGQWAQPTALGFAVFSAGLVLASFRKGEFSPNRKPSRASRLSQPNPYSVAPATG